MAAEVGRHTDIHLSIWRDDACGKLEPADRVPTSRVGRVSPQLSLNQQFTVTGAWASRVEPRSAGKIYSLPCRFRRRTNMGQSGFPSVRHAKSFEDAGEIVGAPAVTQYERSRDGLWVLAYLQFSRRLPEQLF